ncbi:MAG: hypothetical protein A2W22_01955 [Candidatus Levybacteria bacterium RBG_16_35_11]|nr:MAG: hypothetical protein A2W22_01955 [Candidatus Levybacteria bacterium RBG_16_35_11]
MIQKEIETDINNNNDKDTEDRRDSMSRYYQVYNGQIGRWVKKDTETGLIVAVKKSPGKYENLPTTPGGRVKRRKSFWDYF